MAVVVDENLDELARMKEHGVLCIAVASERGDERGLLLWQQSVERLEVLITEKTRLAPH